MSQYLTGGQGSIIDALRSAGGKRRYLAIAHRGDYPEIKLSDYAKLERDGLIKYMQTHEGGVYELTKDGETEARRRTK